MDIMFGPIPSGFEESSIEAIRTRVALLLMFLIMEYSSFRSGVE
jgi:uncharacterized membrane protein